MKKIIKVSLSILFAFLAFAIFQTVQIGKNQSALAEQYTITFMFDDDTDDVILETDENGVITSLVTPEQRDGYYFFGWQSLLNSSIFYDVGDVISGNITVTPYFVEKQNNYKVSKNENGFNLYAVNSTRQIKLAENLATFDELIDAIMEDSVSTKKITLTFDNVSFDSTIALPEFDFVLKGTILSSASPVFEVNENSCTNLTLDNLVIHGSQTEYFIEINDFDSPVNLRLFNCYFYHDSSLQQVISNNNKNLTLRTDNQVYVGDTIYVNYISGNTFNFNNGSSTYKQKIIIPFEIDSNEIIGRISDTTNLPTFICENESYSIDYSVSSENIIQITARMALEFDANGGSYNPGYEVATNIFYKSNTPFPKADNISKTGLNFAGWFGKVNYNSTDYFFDSEKMLEFMNENYDAEKIPEIFVTDISSLSLNNTFTNYLFDPELSSERSFLFYNVFKALGQSSKFIAGFGRIVTLNLDTNKTEKYYCFHGDNLTSMQSPEKEGYSFVCWTTSSNQEYDLSSPVVVDFEITADWQINSYQITFDYTFGNSGTQTTTKTFEFGAEIVYHTPTVEGYEIEGWYDGPVKFDLETMPARDLTIKANWEKKTFTYIVDNKINVKYVINVEFNELLDLIDPERVGYTFYGWADENKNPIDISAPVGDGEKIRYINAIWIVNQHTITCTNGETHVNYTYNFDDPINLPSATWSEHKFLGWYYENDQLFELTNMPDYDITLFAKWKTLEKINISNLDNQTYKYGTENSKYNLDTNISGIMISYKVDDEWKSSVPTEAGTYDVKLERYEDDNYAYYSKIIEGGFTILEQEKDVSLLIAMFFIIFVLEIVAFVIIKQLKKFKISNLQKAFSVVLPFGVFADSQFALLIVSIVLAIFGFACVIYELVAVSKISNRFLENDNEKEDSKNAKTIKQMEDKSNDVSIEQKVDSLLKKEGLAKGSNKKSKFIASSEDTDNTDYIDYFSKNK